MLAVIGDSANLGSIGVQGYHGPLTSFGPFEGDLAVSYAYNDLQSKLSNGLLVCYDYRGPESTQFDLHFQVRVSELAAGTNQLLRWVSHIEGMTDRNVDAAIQVAGNMTIAPISAQTTVEDTTLTNIPVIYHDNDAGPNTISVSGANFTTVVHGNAPGDAFDIVPDPGFIGTTTVTVMVSDQTNPTDQVSTTFQLTVRSDAIFIDDFE